MGNLREGASVALQRPHVAYPPQYRAQVKVLPQWPVAPGGVGALNANPFQFQNSTAQFQTVGGGNEITDPYLLGYFQQFGAPQAQNPAQFQLNQQQSQWPYGNNANTTTTAQNMPAIQLPPEEEKKLIAWLAKVNQNFGKYDDNRNGFLDDAEVTEHFEGGVFGFFKNDALDLFRYLNQGIKGSANQPGASRKDVTAALQHISKGGRVTEYFQNAGY